MSETQAVEQVLGISFRQQESLGRQYFYTDQFENRLGIEAHRAMTGQELVLSLLKASNDPAVVQFGAAVPDPSFLPVRAAERALARAARQHRNRAAAYEFPPGLPELRRQIARRMSAYGCATGADDVVVTNGCQEALVLAR